MSEERETRKEPRRINIFYEIENRFFFAILLKLFLLKRCVTRNAKEMFIVKEKSTFLLLRL